MAEASDAPSSSAAALDVVFYVARSVWSVRWGRHLFRAARVAALPLSLVTVPLRHLASAVLVLCAPLLYLVGFAVAAAQGTLSLLASLKLSAAAGIGIVAGVVLGATSSVVTSYLGMQDSDEDRYERERDSIDYYYDRDDEEVEYEGRDYRYDPDTYPDYRKQHLRASDPDVLLKRRLARGLLSQTIHEEDDSSGE
ncbi:hypothetical protein ISF_02158 [Cordyceps fumosorosea ARSEF 2679]|uniref:Uncharacterized protein n=1 Tax=Cordyceps fumosorosea (strain ARSEF 2679) TaxID=1081104 RepID=A0A168CNU9_CORFA|nr:hypothetical protein ISF_02158 [Cordyceps fumosorosea ARSEF 2679]OAA71607.1 hypothetical protein ISF_02158 [Cordyceps fumosorosea ARSEF 2679]